MIGEGSNSQKAIYHGFLAKELLWLSEYQIDLNFSISVNSGLDRRPFFIKYLQLHVTVKFKRFWTNTMVIM